MRKNPSHTRLHFVGIGGIGMSGIAEVFLNAGYQVSGSDLSRTETIQRLERLGARITQGHDAEQVPGADVVVISSAIGKENPEVQRAKQSQVPVIPRAEMLGELMRGRTGIAVAGTHGKTTTTSLLAWILTQADWDPTMVIGGKVNSLDGNNAKLGEGEYVIAEADESDGSFFHLPATYGIVTNIDNDHLDYFESLERLDEAFLRFVGQLPFYGLAAVCGEDFGVRRCLPRWTKPVVTYGFSDKWDYQAKGVRYKGCLSEFSVFYRNHSLGRVRLNLPGKHNILNALGAISLAHLLGVPFEVIAHALKHFSGVKRRFDIRWRDEQNQQLIVDDYGHHPREIRHTLQAARRFWSGRVLALFQPHRYTRTLHCKNEFLTAFQKADLVFITDIYPAGEEPLEGVTAQALVSEMQEQMGEGERAPWVFYAGNLEQAKSEVFKWFQPNDLLLCLGAGSIAKLPDEFVQLTQKQRNDASNYVVS